MANNAVLGVDDEDELSRCDDKMSDISDQKEIMTADVVMASESENNKNNLKEQRVYQQIVTSSCLDVSPIKQNESSCMISEKINSLPDSNAFSLTFSANQNSTMASTMIISQMQQPQLRAQSSTVSQPGDIPSSNIRINGHRVNLAQYIAKSSVNYFILSFLPPQ